MKDDLKRLVNEFIDETREERTQKVDMQLTKDMPKRFDTEIRKPTFQDFIWWLNEE